eukprot:c8628_g1_i1.p1 GENE.c8628_g1_i1~~c8628_g1_i1.p1  ORF type:complete len:1107 (-),score=297.39 c8628_g1_i1:37-3162(-)
MFDVPIFGRISILKLFRPTSSNQDYLLFCTEKYNMSVLAFDIITQKIVTKVQGNLQSRTTNTKPPGSSDIGIVDPTSRVVALSIMEFVLKIVPIKSPSTEFKVEEAFDVRLEDNEILDLVFIHGFKDVTFKDAPTFGYITRDSRQCRHFKTHQIILKDKDTKRGSWNLPNLENTAHKLIPVADPIGGVLIIGENTVCYFDGQNSRSVQMKASEIQATATVDATRYLLGDQSGSLLLLTLETKNNKVVDLRVETQGSTTIPSTLSYLDSGVVFVGSTLGDSQLVRLLNQRDADGNSLEVIEQMPNIGPIVDLCVVDANHQSRVITASGASKCGTVRYIRNGVGVNEQATLEVRGIKGLFSIAGVSEPQAKHRFLIQSFAQETRVLGFGDDGAMDEVVLPGLDGASRTLLCTDVLQNRILQVTTNSVRLLNGVDQQVIAEWFPPAPHKITVAAASRSQVVISTGLGVTLLHIENSTFQELSSTQMEYEVAALDITPLNGSVAEVVAVGLWKDMSVRLCRLPDFGLIAKEVVSGNVVPRSVLLSTFAEKPHLVVGMGDGQLLIWTISPSGELIEKRRFEVGTQPVTVTHIKAGGVPSVFAASDRPVLLHVVDGKLLCSSVNFKEITHICSFDSDALPDCIAIANDQGLHLASMDNIQKLHMHELAIEGPRRIAHVEKYHCFVAVNCAVVGTSDGQEEEEYYLTTIDARTLEKMSCFKLDQNEMAYSLASCTFANDPQVYVVVGTAFIIPEETEPTSGRVLVMEVNELGELTVVATYKLDGCAYWVGAFGGKLLTSCNARLDVLRWNVSDDSKSLVLDCQAPTQILNVAVDTQDDMILVGDLMKSVSLLKYKKTTNSIEDTVQDYNAVWVSSVAILNSEYFLVADASFNLIVFHKHIDASHDEDNQRMEVVGEFHLGESVNVIRRGCLTKQSLDMKTQIKDSFIYGTVGGVLGIIFVIPPAAFDFFNKLQLKLTEVVQGVGGLSHSEWRAFSNEYRKAPSRGIIDGDLVEMVLELPLDQQRKVAEALNVSVEELVSRVEEMKRLH